MCYNTCCICSLHGADIGLYIPHTPCKSRVFKLCRAAELRTAGPQFPLGALNLLSAPLTQHAPCLWCLWPQGAFLKTEGEPYIACR